jgi:RNA polymerase sigma-70 factor (ECF subfamily)
MTAQTTQLGRDADELARDYQAGIWRYLRFLGCSPELADDLTQETFVAVLKHPFEDRDPRATNVYLRTTARNLFLMSLRSEEKNLVIQNPELAESVWERFDRGDGGNSSLDALKSCLETLTGRAREVIELQYKQNRSRSEIAEQLGMKPDGIKTLLRRTRDLLRQCVQRKTQS